MNKSKKLKPFDEERYAIQQDIILDVPDRVAKNSVRLRDVEDAVKQAEIGVDMLLDQWTNICILNDYLDSGEWQSDFEADERGEIRKELPRGVLAEDSLYNTMDRFKDVIGQMAEILDLVDFPDEEEDGES